MHHTTKDLIKQLEDTLVARRNDLVYKCQKGMQAAILVLDKSDALLMLVSTLEISLQAAMLIHHDIVNNKMEFCDAYNKAQMIHKS